MVKLRSFRREDISQIDEIWRKHHSDDFSVPDRRNAVIDAVVEGEGGKVIAYGQVKLFAEAILILDKDASPRDKYKALTLLMLEAFRGADSAGIRDLYAFIQDPDFENLIAKHFDFEVLRNPGTLLKREL